MSGLLTLAGSAAHAQDAFVDFVQGVEDAGQLRRDRSQFAVDVNNGNGIAAANDLYRIQQDQRLLRYDQRQFQNDLGYSRGYNNGGYSQQPQ